MIVWNGEKAFRLKALARKVSRGWIPNRLAIPTLLDENAFVKRIFEMIDLASLRKSKKGSDPF